MKNYFISILQKILGYERFLLIFAKLKIQFLKYNKVKETFRYFETLVPENGSVAVVGASIGITTIPFVKNNRHVFAYEPIPSNFSVLKKLKKSFNADNLNLFPIALGNHTGHVEMVFPTINGAKKHGLSYVKDVKISDNPEGEIVSITMDQLDARPELSSIKLNALKVVAENYEFEIFSGAKAVIAQNSPIIYCELWANSKRQPVINLIESMNYSVFVLMGGKLVNYAENEKSYSDKHFIFLPKT